MSANKISRKQRVMLTNAEEIFCQSYVNTGNATTAAKEAYPDREYSTERNWQSLAYEKKKLPKIQTRIQEIRDEMNASFIKTREDILKDLISIIDKYKETGKFTNHSLKAIDTFNKMMGFYNNDAEITQNIQINYIQPDKKDD